MQNKLWKWNDFDNLETSKDLKEYWNREYEHTEYSHYTNLDALDSILKTKSFWLSTINGFNDKKDMANIEEKELYFSLCFSTGTSENLALWYLYSGMNGKGGRITYSKNNIKKFITKSVYTLWNCTTNEKILTLDENNMELWFKDVIYCANNNKGNNVYLRYNTMTNHRISKTDFENFEKEYKCFVKSGIWYHEKETRLLVKLKKDAAEFVKRNKNKKYRIVMDFSAVPRLNYYLMLAPEITDLSEVDNKQYIRELRDKYSKVKLSEYNGDIEMKLCEKCQKGTKK